MVFLAAPRRAAGASGCPAPRRNTDRAVGQTPTRRATRVQTELHKLLTASIPLLMSPMLAAADMPRKEAKPDPKPSTAWGKPIGRLQAGIREWTSGKNPGAGGIGDGAR